MISFTNNFCSAKDSIVVTKERNKAKQVAADGDGAGAGAGAAAAALGDKADDSMNMHREKSRSRLAADAGLGGKIGDSVKLTREKSKAAFKRESSTIREDVAH